MQRGSLVLCPCFLLAAACAWCRYIIDIIYKQFLGYMDAGNKIMDLKSIRRKYWRSWWAPIDVISALPIDMIALAFGHDAYTYRIPKLLRAMCVGCPAPCLLRCVLVV